MELLLVRHGRIAGRPMRPRDDDPLSALGEEQARRAAAYLAQDPNYAALVCSPLRRALQTAHIIGAVVKMEPVVIDALTEMNDREMGRLMVGELAERLPFGLRRLTQRAGDLLRAPLIGRVGGAFAKLFAEHTEQRVLIIAHGGVIWGTLAHYFPAQRRDFTRQRQVANCSVTRVAVTPDGAKLLALNETAHLGDAVTY